MEELDTEAIAEELNTDVRIFGDGSVEDDFSQNISDVGEHADESVEDTEKGLSIKRQITYKIHLIIIGPFCNSAL